MRKVGKVDFSPCDMLLQVIAIKQKCIAIYNILAFYIIICMDCIQGYLADTAMYHWGLHRGLTLSSPNFLQSGFTSLISYYPTFPHLSPVLYFFYPSPYLWPTPSVSITTKTTCNDTCTNFIHILSLCLAWII